MPPYRYAPRLKLRVPGRLSSYLAVAPPPAPNSQGGLAPGAPPAGMRHPKAPTTTHAPTTPAKAPTRPVKPGPPKAPGVLAIEQTRDRHMAQANKSAQWLASVLTALQNSNVGASSALQANLGTSALAYEQAGQVTGPQIGSVNGGMLASGLPATAATGQANALTTMTGALRNDLQRAGLADVTSSMISGASRYASSLPSVYADKINGYLSDLNAYKEKIRQFGVEQETARLRIQNDAQTAEANRISRENIAAMNEQGRNARKEADLQAQAQRAAQATVGGYKGMKPADYQKLVGTWVTKIDTMNRATDKTPATADNPKGGTRPRYTAQEVFRLATNANLRPRDALRLIIQTRYDTVDNQDAGEFLRWLSEYLPRKNAARVVQDLTGINPLGPKPSRTEAGLGD